MTFKIDVKVEAAAFKRSLTALEKREFPYAAARALTFTAKDVQKNTVKRMQRVLDRPTRFTLNAFRVLPAKKNYLVAEVGFREFTSTSAGFRSYLEPLEYGGPRPPKRFEKRLRAAGVMRNDEFAVPSRYNGVKRDRYGNIPASVVVKVLSQLSAFNDAGYDANETSKSRKRAGAVRSRYFVFGEKRNKKGDLPRGIYEVVSKDRLRAVFIFVKQPVYRAMLGFRELSDKTTRDRLPINFRLAMDHALKTSRLK